MSKRLPWKILLPVLALLLGACAASQPTRTTAGNPVSPTNTIAPAKPAAAKQRQTLYDPTADPQADIDTALALTKVDHKNILLDFGADWCPDCWSLDTMFNDPSIKSLLDKYYHVVRIDVGQWDHNMELSDTYDHVADKGIPAVAVLDSDGAVLTTTADGFLADARDMQTDEILTFLTRWLPQESKK